MTGTLPKFGDGTTIVVLGASGDLAKKKTFPALFGLYRNGLLPKNVEIIGYARSKMTQEEYHERISHYFKTPDDQSKEQAKKFLENTCYVQGPYDGAEGYQRLNEKIEEFEKKKPEPHYRLFYLALPPSVFLEAANGLKKYVYPGEGKARIIIEKPFGHDLASSRELQDGLAPLWKESEIFRIDHYLGKEMVKNLNILRFGNQFLSAVWDKNTISNVQISFKEPFGTEGRGGYFNDIGIIRDVIQNHLLQVLSILAMERPVTFGAEDIRDEKVKVLRCVDILNIDDVILGQYGPSEDGKKPGYTDDDGVPDDSRAVTFAALHLQIHNDRWEGVPFILRAGKALDEGKVEIRVQFRDVTKGVVDHLPRNELVIRIQPSESIYMKMNSKLPGLTAKNIVTDLDLTYNRRYSDVRIPEAYESLILDCLKGDHTNFVRNDELDISWKIFTDLLHKIDEDKSIVPEKYAYGSRGPGRLKQWLRDRGYVRNGTELYQWPVTKGSS